ncbi:MAG: acyl-CoA synthetase [Candidatus Solincola sediminis]|uniref:Acyl-CoA synthetase n=1 Tax=Candidatus Solincola sediminis TaxID=1797199 RepID=A0A1F2WFF5_9ACTN|nr:MAG: acyl-CoA synthetase [Candidatus Solincola sediminis]OFW57879.1 MAG: acyl-CoA synthetase [Candidatus Solincola sediminis]
MLDEFFRPSSITLIGASESPGKVGTVVLENIIKSGYGGKIYPVNPSHKEVQGLGCYPSITDLPETPALAIIIVPAKNVEQVLEECAHKGIKGVVIITAGFKESGQEGYRREKRLYAIVKQNGMRVLGPNCLGIADTNTPFNATFANRAPMRGKVAFMSQSGALCTAVLGWSEENSLGFSEFISLGNKMDLNESDFLEALESDGNTNVIAAYLEGVVNGERFLEVTRRVSRTKPVIVFKAGVTQAGARAVSSHTGTLAGSESAYTAAFKKCGAVRADTIKDLFMMARGFANQPPPKGGRVAVVTNAGGPGIITSDALERGGLTLAQFKEETAQELRNALPKAASAYNPVDVLGDAGPDRYKVAIQTIIKDPGIDALLVILTPQAITKPEDVATAIVESTQGIDMTLLSIFMGGPDVNKAEEIFNEADIPNFRFPEEAVGTLRCMKAYNDFLMRPRDTRVRFQVDKERVRQVIRKMRDEHRKELVEVEAQQILLAYGLPVAKTMLATNLEEGIKAGREIGYPVVAKIASPQILHKTDVGGVAVGINNSDELISAYEKITDNARRMVPDADIWGILIQEMLPESRELIIGMNRDAQFGPLLLVGLGGVYVEVLKDVSLRLAPIGEEEAREMLHELKSYWLLQGARGERPADIDSVIEAMLRVSQLVTDFPDINELDINPLRVMDDTQGCLAADARIILEE